MYIRQVKYYFGKLTRKKIAIKEFVASKENSFINRPLSKNHYKKTISVLNTQIFKGLQICFNKFKMLYLIAACMASIEVSISG